MEVMEDRFKQCFAYLAHFRSSAVKVSVMPTTVAEYDAINKAIDSLLRGIGELEALKAAYEELLEDVTDETILTEKSVVLDTVTSNMTLSSGACAELQVLRSSWDVKVG